MVLAMVEDTSNPQRVVASRSLFIDDAARVLGISRRTVYYRIRDGRLQTIRTRCGSQRVLVTSVEAMILDRHIAKHDDRRRGRFVGAGS
jgi:excisionase family DNA binding protein